MLLSHVVAVAENGVIGRDGGLPWHIPGDLKRFKAATMGKMVLMGRKTYESIGRPLPGRLNLVLSRSYEVGAHRPGAGLVLCGDLSSALALAQGEAAHWQDELCIIGGGHLYAQTMHVVSRLYLSRIHMTVDGDTWYPEVPADFRLVSEEECDGPPPFTWTLWERAVDDRRRTAADGGA